jgi:ribosomal protein S18 acetylase RimI-like enzyme
MSVDNQNFDRGLFQDTLSIKTDADFTFDELCPLIRDLEEASFGEYIHEEELRLITEEGYGKVFMAFDNSEPTPRLVGYQVVLLKEYDKATEARLQPLLQERRAVDNTVMHDDVHFDPNTTVYFHLIGTRKGYEGRGIASRLKQEAIQALSPEDREKKRKVCIRVNNLPSLAVNMKVLGVCPTSLKPVDYSIIGSRETNFNLETIEGTAPIFDPEHIKTREIMSNSTQNVPEGKSFLVPIDEGGQKDLEDGVVEKLMGKIFEQGYIVRGLFKGKDLSLEGDSYFYCEKRPSSN